MLRPAIYLTAMLSLGACVVVPVQPPVQENACGASDLQYLVGGSARVLERMRFGTDLRIIRPGTAVTMDFSPTRLNIAIDDFETVTRVYCG